MGVEVNASASDVDRLRDALHAVADAGAVGAVTIRTRAADPAQREVAVGADASAAWTLDACRTSIYDNDVRARLDLPLGDPQLREDAVAVRAVRYAPQMLPALRHCFARDPGLRVHLYRPEGVLGATIGHVCVVAPDIEDARRRAEHAADYLSGTLEEEQP